MKCDKCPAAWEDSTNNENGYECDSYGCVIRGLYFGGEGGSCRLTEKQVKKRLKEWENYIAGYIIRPKWVVEKFMRELDAKMSTVECGLPPYPPKLMRDGCYKHISGSTDIYYQSCHAYEEGYQDCKDGKPSDPHSHYGKKREEEDIFHE